MSNKPRRELGLGRDGRGTPVDQQPADTQRYLDNWTKMKAEVERSRRLVEGEVGPRIDEKDQRVKDAKSQVESMEGNIVALKAQNKQLEIDKQSLSNDSEAKGVKLKEKEDEYRRLVEENRRLAEENRKLKEKSQALEHHSSGIMEEIADVYGQLERSNKLLEKLLGVDPSATPILQKQRRH
jgi:chromosome segregation ATPase